MGYPEGAEITHAIDVAPALMALDPINGSAGGTKIKVTGSGFGTATTGLSLRADGNDICHTVEVFEYGKFYCYTNAEIITGLNMTIALDGVVSAESYVAGDVAYN